MLKFSETEARFPARPEELSTVAVAYMADQMKVDRGLLSEYRWSGRTIEYYRAQVRDAFGFRELSRGDEDKLAAEVCPVELRDEQLREAPLVRCRGERIEPPGHIERIIGSARASFEKQFFERTVSRLSELSVDRLNNLVAVGAAPLESDPGKVSLDTLLREVDKLAALRALELPTDLFADASDKLVDAWRARAARMFGSDLAPLDGVVPKAWRKAVVDEKGRVERIPYELCVLVALRDAIRHREIYVDGGNQWRNREDDLPGDFDTAREVHYAAIRQPLDPTEFIAGLRQRMTDALTRLDTGLAENTTGGIRLTRWRGEQWISVPKLENLEKIKAEVARRWGTLDLLDVLEDADFLTDFTAEFTSMASREVIDRDTLRRRLLLDLFALGTNMGIRAIVNTGEHAESEAALRHMRRALSPLFWSNINPYGRFRLDMNTRLDLTQERVAG